ncbi:MAG: hypothetical protein ACK5IC_10860 [Moheibacter sp.]
MNNLTFCLKISFCLIFLNPSLISCKNEFTIQRQNDEDDKREGEKVMDNYFDNILLEKPSENKLLYSEAFFKESSKEELQQQNQFIEEKLGKIEGKTLQHWETFVVTGTSSKSEYLFVYNVEREKYNSVETFYLMKEPSDSIKIHSYKIDSKGLLTSE